MGKYRVTHKLGAAFPMTAAMFDDLLAGGELTPCRGGWVRGDWTVERVS